MAKDTMLKENSRTMAILAGSVKYGITYLLKLPKNIIEYRKEQKELGEKVGIRDSISGGHKKVVDSLDIDEMIDKLEEKIYSMTQRANKVNEIENEIIKRNTGIDMSSIENSADLATDKLLDKFDKWSDKMADKWYEKTTKDKGLRDFVKQGAPSQEEQAQNSEKFIKKIDESKRENQVNRNTQEAPVQE